MPPVKMRSEKISGGRIHEKFKKQRGISIGFVVFYTLPSASAARCAAEESGQAKIDVNCQNQAGKGKRLANRIRVASDGRIR